MLSIDNGLQIKLETTVYTLDHAAEAHVAAPTGL